MWPEHGLDRLHSNAVSSRWLGLFTSTVRALVALAFLPSGYIKLVGHRFTELPTSDPVGAFFNGFFEAEAYYRFVGAAQILAAVLLLFRWTAPLGVVIYFPIVLNIFVITCAVGFGGTAVIAGMMTLACLYLLCWYYDLWKGLLPGFSARSPSIANEPVLLTTALTVAAAIGFLGLTGLHLARLHNRTMYAPAFLVLLGEAIAVAAAFTYLKRTAAARYYLSDRNIKTRQMGAQDVARLPLALRCSRVAKGGCARYGGGGVAPHGAYSCEALRSSTGAETFSFSSEGESFSPERH